jgi:nitroreductase
MLLAAHALGWGACFMTGPLVAREELGRILLVRPPWRLAALVPLGRPAGPPGGSSRAGLEEVCAFEPYGTAGPGQP